MEERLPTDVLDGLFRAIDRSLKKERNLEGNEIGIVHSVREGIAQVYGLPNVQTDELVQFQNDVYGLAYNLDPDTVGVILLDEERDIDAGDEVRPTGQTLNVPVGNSLLGRTVDALGRPLDHMGPIRTEQRLPAERAAPSIMHRTSVETPLQTGILAIDSILPIGRGQRELILGDRQSGKTAIAIDTIINQKESDVVCIYCAVGKQRASVQRVLLELKSHDAMDYTIVVTATSSTPAGLQYIAPYAATSMGEYFMEEGRDVLIVYDDLTWHARAYRELALLLRRPPGREAYPGDIFYLHARLLERSTHLKPKYGGGSMTALPIIETQAQDISAFIPTNLISITDGQIYLSPELYQKDVLPAIDIGKSVSRVGGAAQLPAYRSVAKELKLSYAQFEEMESFARFSSRLDEETRRQIERGRRIRDVLKQSQFDPLTVAEQIELIRAVTGGLLDAIPVEWISDAKQAIRLAVRELPDEVKAELRGGEELDEEQRNSLDEAIDYALQPFLESEASDH